MGAPLNKVLAVLERHRHLFDLTAGNLGADLCKAATDGAQQCIASECNPDGTRWDDLSEAYEEWKSFTHPGHPISLLEGVMDNPREVAGELHVTPELAAVTYGVSDRARLEAEWFQDPKNPNQPPRKFFDFTAESLSRVREILDARFSTI